MQHEILEESPELDVVVFAVWFNMVASDRRSRWPAGALADPRVVHLWDGDQLLGGWYGEQQDGVWEPGKIVWDAYYLYGPKARWDGTLSSLQAWGYPIVEDKEQLRLDFQRVAGGGPPRASG